jgi:O-acetyl-ADP-ribose deacetylase (regulator of RNase III)
VSGIRLWNGDICDLEVDAIVVPTTTMLWMTCGVAAAVKQRGGHGIEFEAVGKAPQLPGAVVATSAGLLASRHVIHAVTLGPDRHTSAAAIDAACRAALRLADQMGLQTVAFPALGSPLGGVPLAECARIMLRAIHETRPACRSVVEVVLALRGARTYEAFRAELGRQRVLRAVPIVPGAHLDLAGGAAEPESPGDGATVAVLATSTVTDAPPSVVRSVVRASR